MQGTLKRKVSGSINMIMEGQATLTKKGNLYLYQEEVFHEFGRATQSYLYNFHDGITIYFPDGRLFVSTNEPTHLCGQDLYHVSCSFVGNQLKKHVVVKGPKKDYIIETQIDFKNSWLKAQSRAPETSP